MKYEIEYTFIGRGWQTIKAKSEEEAENKFYEGDYEFDDREEQSSYEIFQIDCECEHNYCDDDAVCINCNEKQ
jgi:hypothetical protein